jgi:NitT/TauT family transport system permease protein
VAAAWVELARSGELAGNAADSLYRAAASLALAVAVGGGLGIGMATWRPLALMLGPLVELIYPMPKSALIPVTVLWLGFGGGSKIPLIFLGYMPQLQGVPAAPSSNAVRSTKARRMG